MSAEVHHVSARSVRTYNRQRVEVPFAPGTFLVYRRALGSFHRTRVVAKTRVR